MNASDVLDLAQSSGVTLKLVEPDTVRLVASKGNITAELRRHIKDLKTEILALLRAQEARIAAFTSRPCASCGGSEYAFLPDGRLICPCYFAKLEESKKPRPSIILDKTDNRGLARTCSQCRNLAAWYGPGARAYCDECWQASGHALPSWVVEATMRRQA